MTDTHPVKPELTQHNMQTLYQDWHYQRLVRNNRLLLSAMIGLMSLVLILGSFLLSSHDLLLNQLPPQSEMSMPSNSKIEVEQLKGELIGLVTGTIDTKLKSLEKNIERGRPLTALETVKSLKEDVNILRGYTKPLPAPVSIEQKAELIEANQLLIHEVAQLKQLIYLTLGSSSLVFIALTGIWFRGRRQLARYPAHYLESAENK